MLRKNYLRAENTIYMGWLEFFRGTADGFSIPDSRAERTGNSDRDNIQAGDQLIVFSVHSRYAEAELHRGNANSEILKRQRETAVCQLAFQPANEPSDPQRDRVDGNIPAKPVDEGQSPSLTRLFLCAVGAMHEFGDCDDRNAKVNPAKRDLYSFKDLEDRKALPFTRDQIVGIENHSHAGGFQGLRF